MKWYDERISRLRLHKVPILYINCMLKVIFRLNAKCVKPSWLIRLVSPPQTGTWIRKQYSSSFVSMHRIYRLYWKVSQLDQNVSFVFVFSFFCNSGLKSYIKVIWEYEEMMMLNLTSLTKLPQWLWSLSECLWAAPVSESRLIYSVKCQKKKKILKRFSIT